MAFNRPTLIEITDRVRNDLKSRLTGTDPWLRRAMVSVLARVMSGAIHLCYGFLSWLALQLFVLTADEEYLQYHATEWNVPRKDPVAANGPVTFTGTQDGVTISAGTVWQRSDGMQYTTDVDATIASGSATVTVTASVAGANGNMSAGATGSLITPISKVSSTVTVAAGGIGGGTDIETLDSWRQRILDRKQNPPHGGAESDYNLWATSVSGITRAWTVGGLNGLGTVGVYVVNDDATPITPDAATITTVQNYIDGLDIKPVTANVTVQAPTLVAMDFTIALTPNDAATQAAVQAELTDLITREAAPGVANSTQGEILLSHINEAISLATGETDHTLTAPSADYTPNAGEMATMGTITWQ